MTARFLPAAAFLAALFSAPSAAARLPINDRIAAVSARFLGAPYRLHPLGEGPKGEFDRSPLMNLKAFDCTTFVEEVMALALSKDEDSAYETLRKIRYKNGIVAYQTRNHFPETDWIPNNEKAGFIDDITRKIAGKKTAVASKFFSKRAWYAAKNSSDIQGFGKIPQDDLLKKLRRLQALGDSFPDQTAAVPYIPTKNIRELLGVVPTGTIVNLVRADSPRLPTLISHQGFLIWKNGRAFMRHASSKGSVQDVLFLDYLGRYRDADPALLGVNLNAVKNRP